MENPTNPEVVVIFHTKEGHEYSRRIKFRTSDEYDRWDFTKYVLDRLQYEAGMFHTDQAQFISIDIIARIEYEAYDGVLF